MKECSSSYGQNSQLVHWWVLVHSGPSGPGSNFKCFLNKPLVPVEEIIVFDKTSN